jgi:hypothetical protein
LNIDRAFRAVAFALLGLTALALVTPVRFEVGFRSAPPAFLHLIIVVLAARTGGFVRAVGLTAFLTAAPVTTRLVSR